MYSLVSTRCQLLAVFGLISGSHAVTLHGLLVYSILEVSIVYMYMYMYMYYVQTLDRSLTFRCGKRPAVSGSAMEEGCCVQVRISPVGTYMYMYVHVHVHTPSPLPPPP